MGDDSSNDSDEYSVDKILDKRLDVDGTTMYKVRWKDFGSDDDTWIPEIDLFCPDLLEDFEREYAKRKKTKHRTKRKPAIRQRKKTRGYDSDSYEEEEQFSPMRSSTRKRKSHKKSLAELSSDSDFFDCDEAHASSSPQSEELRGWTCNTCKLYDDSEDYVQCTECKHYFHIQCISLSEEEEKPKKWVCDSCLDTCEKCKTKKREPVVYCNRCSVVYHKKCLPEENREDKGEWECMNCSKWRHNIRKIITFRKSADDEESREYFVKWKDRSYRRCSWVPETWLSRLFPQQLRTFCKNNLEPVNVSELIPESWKTPERVVATKNNKYLVKWLELPYDECTWENISIIDKSLLQEYCNRIRTRPKKKIPADLKNSSSLGQYKFKSSPSYLKFKLFDYQLEGLNWLFFNWLKKRNSILADEMGLGKTIQTIAFCGAIFNIGESSPVIIVVPLSTLNNWAREFANWMPQTNCLSYCGTKESRKIIREYEFYFKDIDDNMTNKFDILLTSYESVISDITYLKKFHYGCLIVDEAHRLKNLKSKLFNCLDGLSTSHRVFLTGTPLQNDLFELFSIMKILKTDKKEWRDAKVFMSQFNELMTSTAPKKMILTKKNKKDNITEKPISNNTQSDGDVQMEESDIQNTQASETEMELENDNEYVSPDYSSFEDSDSSSSESETNSGPIEVSQAVKHLHSIIAPHFLRRLKRDVLKNLPPKVELAVPCPLSNIQKEFYKAALVKNYGLLNPKNPKAASLTNILMTLRHVCNHPYIIPSAEPSGEGESKEVIMNRLVNASGKLQLLDRLLIRLKEQKHKALIFSQSVMMLNILEDYIHWRNFAFERIDGQTPASERQAAIDRYNNSEDSFLFLISTKAGGLGLNLATADTVIIYDSDFNPHNDLQALSRAHRIGQTNLVMIYRLFCKNTVEQACLERARSKLVLEHIVVGKMEQKFNKNEISNMIRAGAQKLFEEEENTNATQAFDEIQLGRILDREKCLLEYQTQAKEQDAVRADGLDTFSLTDVWKTLESEDNLEDGSIHERNFWEKLLKNRAQEYKKTKEQSTVLRKRRARFEVSYGNDEVTDDDEEYAASPAKRKLKLSKQPPVLLKTKDPQRLSVIIQSFKENTALLPDSTDGSSNTNADSSTEIPLTPVPYSMVQKFPWSTRKQISVVPTIQQPPAKATKKLTKKKLAETRPILTGSEPNPFLRATSTTETLSNNIPVASTTNRLSKSTEKVSPESIPTSPQNLVSKTQGNINLLSNSSESPLSIVQSKENMVSLSSTPANSTVNLPLDKATTRYVNTLLQPNRGDGFIVLPQTYQISHSQKPDQYF